MKTPTDVRITSRGLLSGHPEDGREAFSYRSVVEDLFGQEPAWQEFALCRESDPEAFFPEKGGSTRDAKRICSRCPVRVDCLQHAVGNNEPFGIWGGLSERERRRFKRRAA